MAYISDNSENESRANEGENFGVSSAASKNVDSAVELSQKSWDEASKRWDASPQGRAIIRMFSRGGLGAAAFAFGGWYASRGVGMRGYHPEIAWSEIEKTKFLQYIAKSIDVFAGKPIKAIAGLFTDDPERWVHFRPTNNFINNRDGRSLGHEAVSVTFDFFCSSVADAFGRDIADVLDPNAKHEWQDKNGHIKPIEALKSFGKSLFRYITYNGGEDWAVAVPYVYYMRAQRKLINHFSPRFKYDSDRALNGGSFKVDKDTNLVGNYGIEGLVDLQGRFTAYNIGTLMYREAYNHVDNLLHGKHTALYGAPYKEDADNSITHDIGKFFKWTARSIVKGVITMTPVVPFFSIFRVSQSKHRGLFINQDPSHDGVLGYSRPDGRRELLHANEQIRIDSAFRNNNPDVYFSSFNNGDWSISPDYVREHPLSNPNKPFDPHAKTFGVFDKGMNAIGSVQSRVRSRLNYLPQKWFGSNAPDRRAMNTYLNAAFSYTPYMWAKRESAILWDNGKMDEAAERMIDGIANFDYKEFKAGAREVGQAVLHKTFDDPEREQQAHERILKDPSPADGMSHAEYLAAFSGSEKKHNLSWQERMVHSGKAAEHSDNIKKRGSSYVENEEMQRVLRDFQPPTNSVH